MMTTVEDTKAGWRRRAPDLSHETLAEVIELTQALRKGTTGLSAPLGALSFRYDLATDDLSLVLQLGHATAWRLTPTHWSFSQLCQWVDAPSNWLRGLGAGTVGMVLDEALHRNEQVWGQQLEWLITGTPGRKLLRAAARPADDRTWDYSVAEFASDALAPGGWGRTQPDSLATVGFYTSDRNMFLYFAHRDNPIEVDGTQLQRDILIMNGEVGQLRFGIAPFLYDPTTGARFLFRALDREARLPLPLDALLSKPEALADAAAHYLHAPLPGTHRALVAAYETRFDRAGLAERRLAEVLHKVPAHTRRLITEQAVRYGWGTTRLWPIVRSAATLGATYPNADARDIWERKVGELISWGGS